MNPVWSILKKNLEILKALRGKLSISTKDSQARLCGLGSCMLIFYTALVGLMHRVRLFFDAAFWPSSCLKVKRRFFRMIVET